MSNKYPSQGVALQLQIANTYTTIAALAEMELPEGTVETVETTDINVTHNKTFDTTGLSDAGEFSGTGFMDPAGATLTAISAFVKTPAANSLTNWKVTFTDAAPTSHTWAAIVTKFKAIPKMADFLKFSFAGKVSGAVTGW